MAWDLVNVEALPHSVLMNGVSWDWETFPEYMNAIERNGIALNVSFLVPLSALRFYVLGDEAAERAATEEETRRMAQVFREAMLAGRVWIFAEPSAAAYRVPGTSTGEPDDEPRGVRRAVSCDARSQQGRYRDFAGPRHDHWCHD